MLARFLLLGILVAWSIGPMALAQESSFPTPEEAQASAEYDAMASCGTSCGVSGGHRAFDEYYERPAPIASWWMNSETRRFCQSVADDTVASNRWPQPFVCADRHDTRLPFQLMVAKGWAREHTLDEDYFTSEDKLNPAGRLWVRRILTEGIPEYRAIYVRRGQTEEATSTRMDSVQQYASKVVVSGPLPPVHLTGLPTPRWPAERVETIERKYNEEMPVPRLPIELGGSTTDSD